MIYAAISGLSFLASVILATTDSPPQWSFPAIIAAMGSALVYAYRKAEDRANNAEKEKYDLAGRVTLALADSSNVLARVLDALPEDPPPRPHRRTT